MAEFVKVAKTNELEPGQAPLDWSAGTASRRVLRRPRSGRRHRGRGVGKRLGRLTARVFRHVCDF